MFTLNSTETGGCIVAVIAGSAFLGGVFADWRRRRKTEREQPNWEYRARMPGLLDAAAVEGYLNGLHGMMAGSASTAPAYPDDDGEAEADAFIAELHAEDEQAPPFVPDTDKVLGTLLGHPDRGWYVRVVSDQEAFMAAHRDDVEAVDDWIARGCPGPGRPEPWLPVSGAWEALELEPA